MLYRVLVDWLGLCSCSHVVGVFDSEVVAGGESGGFATPAVDFCEAVSHFGEGFGVVGFGHLSAPV